MYVLIYFYLKGSVHAMDLMDKLKILSNAAKYDVSCSSSGSKRKNSNSGIGNASEAGICHSFTPDGRCISLLKILFSNDCVFDCKYCINGASGDFQRVSFTPDDVCNLTINFYIFKTAICCESFISKHNLIQFLLSRKMEIALYLI